MFLMGKGITTAQMFHTLPALLNALDLIFLKGFKAGIPRERLAYCDTSRLWWRSTIYTAMLARLTVFMGTTLIGWPSRCDKKLAIEREDKVSTNDH
ncbi:hypothetical protein V3C99_013795 [Haemonchus contortus]